MAIDFQQIYAKIREIGIGARERRERIENLRKHARHLLEENANELDYLRRIVEQATEKDPNIRCALPLNESLASHVPVPDSVKEATLIAADGSQINPDRHASVQFCLVNVGAISMCLNSHQSPAIFTESELLYGDELDTKTGTMTEGMIALRRDLKERAKLEELSREIEGPVVTFTDGPIELWGARGGEDAESFHEALTNYKSVLSRLQERDVITAGYVDKPSADLVVRLLELVQAQSEQPKSFRDYHPLRGVSDRWLYGETGIPCWDRANVRPCFAIQTPSEKDYKGVLSLHFFYLNVGTQGHPWPVRVEIPDGWPTIRRS
jgi:hypothetical protein